MGQQEQDWLSNLIFGIQQPRRKVTLRDIADALESPEAVTARDGYYQNKRGIWGYYATVRSGDHWYMVAVPHVQQPVRLLEIAEDLRLPGAQVVQDGNYRNRNGVLGYYTTVDCWGDHWYLVSVSNVGPPDIQDFEWLQWEKPE